LSWISKKGARFYHESRRLGVEAVGFGRKPAHLGSDLEKLLVQIEATATSRRPAVEWGRWTHGTLRRTAPAGTTNKIKKGLPHPLSATVAPFRSWRVHGALSADPRNETHLYASADPLSSEIGGSRSRAQSSAPTDEGGAGVRAR
jgi:hypothetical protein